MQTVPLWENADLNRSIIGPIEGERDFAQARRMIPFWERYTLTIAEAASYFRIGEHKLRQIVNEDRDADFILWNGNRPQIKRRKFEKYVDGLSLI